LNPLRVVVVILAAFVVCGCAPNKPVESLPAYHWTDESTALADLRARAASVKTLSAECGITLSRPDGQRVQFDGALVMEPQGKRVRLRAWKFNRAVFDLTLNDDGLWLWTMDDPGRREQILPASLRAADFVRELSLFTGGFFLDEPAPTMKTNGPILLLARATEHGLLHCEVDRATLTPRRFYADDETKRQRFELILSNYRVVNGVAWSTKLSAKSDMGRVVVDERDVELNGELAPGAFSPPPRAEKRK
jgi:hypothetical protein